MSEFDKEMNRHLDKIVQTRDYRDWVNPEDKRDQEITQKFRATPVSRASIEENVEESVDGLPVKDRDIVEGEVSRRFLGQELDEDESKVEENGEVVRGNLGEASEGETNNVPEGNIRKVTKWVGDDKDRAQRALDVENQKENPRKSLIEKLEEVIED